MGFKLTVTGGMTMEQIVNTVEEIWRMTYGQREEGIQFHRDAQLLVVSGMPDQIKFIQTTLQALRMKVELDRHRLAAESKPKTEELKSGVGGSGGSK